MKNEDSAPKKTTAKKRAPRKKTVKEPAPLMAQASMRRNLSSNIERTDKYKNIDDGMIPFKNSGNTYGKQGGTMDIKDAVILCQKAYYNFAIFRNMIDLMTEFSIIKISILSRNSRSAFATLYSEGFNLLNSAAALLKAKIMLLKSASSKFSSTCRNASFFAPAISKSERSSVFAISRHSFACSSVGAIMASCNASTIAS